MLFVVQSWKSILLHLSFPIQRICLGLDMIISQLVYNWIWELLQLGCTHYTIRWLEKIKQHWKESISPFCRIHHTQSSELCRIQEKFSFVFVSLQGFSWIISPEQSCCAVICAHHWVPTRTLYLYPKVCGKLYTSCLQLRFAAGIFTHY